MSWYRFAQAVTIDGQPIQPNKPIYWKDARGGIVKGIVSTITPEGISVEWRGQMMTLQPQQCYSSYSAAQSTVNRPAGMRSPAYLSTLPVSTLTPAELDAVRQFSRLRKLKNKGGDISGVTDEMKARLGPHGTNCDICNRMGPVAIDHDHLTGQVRGLLCQHCNKALGLFGDDAANLQKAIQYLSKYPQTPKSPYITFKGKERSQTSPAQPYQKRSI